jgi:putative transposase
MSARGNGHDNASDASCFHCLKVECLHSQRFDSREAMRHAVFDDIETE